jgi:predicted nucleic acid binding AN1-type Zn finger protein
VAKFNVDCYPLLSELFGFYDLTRLDGTHTFSPTHHYYATCTYLCPPFPLCLVLILRFPYDARPAKKKCQASIVITAPPLPAATQTVTSPGPSTTTPLISDATSSSNDEAPRSPGGSVLTKQLPATLASSSTLKCPHPAVRIVGDCSFCGKSFCGNHRLPEHHGW